MQLDVHLSSSSGALTTWWAARRIEQMAGILGWNVRLVCNADSADRMDIDIEVQSNRIRVKTAADFDGRRFWEALHPHADAPLRPHLRPAWAEDPPGPALRFEEQPVDVPWTWHCRRPWQLPEERLLELMTRRGWTLATAESCTGGMLAHRITSVAGSSAYFRGTVVAYANDVKETALGVPPQDLAMHGAVSEPVARAMAEGIRIRFATDAALSTTGIAGPGGGSPQKPVGTVWLGMHMPSFGTFTARFQGRGSRHDIIEQASTAALFMMLHQLENLPLP